MDYTPHVFKTTDGGQSWTDISSNLPNIPVNDIIVSSSENILFVATDLNVWYSINDGASWDILGNGLPLTVVMDLKLHEPTQTLYAGTFGRAMHRFEGVIDYCLGIEDHKLTNTSVILSPNPATSEFTISLDMAFPLEGTVQLFDLSGKKLRNLFQGDFGAHKTIQVKTDGLAAGIYLVKVTSGNQSVTKKLIIN